MSARQWFRSAAGLVRAEARGALPMMIVLCLAGAAVLGLARWLFEVTPESLLRDQAHAWWVLAWAGAIPLCAELFGGGGRSVAPATLRPLAVRSSAVLDAKLVVLALGALVLWVWIGAVDLALDTQLARTKVLPSGGEATVRLLIGSAALALIVTGLVAAIVRSALAATVVGLMVQGLLGVLLLNPEWTHSYQDPRVPAGVVRAATYYAVHPVVLCLAALAIGWSLSLRGAAKSDSAGGFGLRALSATLWAGLATATALGSSAWTTASCDPIDFDDPDARIGWVMPSPDGRRVGINLYRRSWGSSGNSPRQCIENAWILDLTTGEAWPAMTPREIARRIPFGAPNSGIRGWDDDGQALWLELAGGVPWIRTEGRIDQEQNWSGVKTGTLPQVWPQGEYRHDHALDRFLASSDPAMAGRIEALKLRGLRGPRANPSVLFGWTRDGQVYRADARAGTVQPMEGIPSDVSYFAMDRNGVWILLPETARHGAASGLCLLSHESIRIPEGWVPSPYSDSELIVRERGLLATKEPQSGSASSDLEWGWVRGDGVEPALVGHGVRIVVDLDGDRFLGLSWSRNSVKLFDADGDLIKVLFESRAVGVERE